MPLSDVRFQDAAQAQLQRALHAGRVPHAYLFAGPTGVGKEMLAARLAQVLLCSHSGVGSPGIVDAAPSTPKPIEEPAVVDATPGLFGPAEDERREEPQGLFGDVHASSPPGADATEQLAADDPAPPAKRISADGTIDACGSCIECTLFAAGTHPDFHRVHRMLAKFHPDSLVRNRKATVVSVDVIRHFLLGPIGRRPSRERAKVFLIIEAERMSESAQNALLKTLEEPPGDSYLILLAASADAMLATTRSRCQLISFGTLPTQFIVEQLTADGRISTDAATFLAELSQGSLGLAHRYNELGVMERVEPVCDAMRRAANDPLSASKALQEIAKDLTVPLKKYQDDEEGDTNAARDAQLLVLAMTSTLLRDAQRLAVGAAPIVRPTLPRRASSYALRPADIRQAARAIAAAEYQIGRNAHTGLIFDSLGVALNRAGALTV